MKRITILLFVVLLGGAFTGCNLDERSKSVLPAELTTFDDLTSYRNGLYLYSRACHAPGLYITADMQIDCMDPTLSFGNHYVSAMRWSTTSRDGDYVAPWFNNYLTISSINFFFDNYGDIKERLEKSLVENPDSATLKEQLAFIAMMEGEAYLLRAMCEYQLIKYFCGNYVDDASAQNALGIVISRRYDSTAQEQRKSLYDSYQAIEDDLAQAKVLLAGIPGPFGTEHRLTYDCVIALEAKLYLQKGNYPKALEAATTLINSGTYTLAGSAGDMTNLWTNDTGGELIYSFYAAVGEGGASYAPSLFNEVISGVYQTSFIPTQTMLELFPTNDIRRNAYFSRQSIPVGTSLHSVYILVKYDGNPALRVNANIPNYLNSVKVHRLGDIYLIGAEAAAMSGEEGVASGYLNDLREKRITGWVRTTYTGTQLMDEIKTERTKEMFMENSRLNDLKRWGDPLVRTGNSQTAADGSSITNQNFTTIAIPGNDSRFVWPIPQGERDGNPNIQQNPGW